MTPWELHGFELANCNCDTGCPCQFMALPTHGNCEAAGSFEFSNGHYGDTDLSGTRAAMVLKWPGPIHEGNGTMQIVVDDSANQAQRDALTKIMTGEDTNDMATMWWVFSAMSPTKLAPLFLPISFAMDMQARTGHAHIPGVLETRAEPLKNPVTGAELRARINLPHGFEFTVAEIARGATTTQGEIDLAIAENSHVHMVEIHLSNTGIVRPH